MAEWLFKKTQMPRSDIDFLMEAFAAFGYKFGKPPPFSDHNDLHSVIDSIPLGDAPWHCITARHTGPLPAGEVPPWMLQEFEVWTRDIRVLTQNMLANPDFKHEFHTAPYREFDINGRRQYSHLMSANWAWRQAVSFICVTSIYCILTHFEGSD